MGLYSVHSCEKGVLTHVMKHEVNAKGDQVIMQSCNWMCFDFRNLIWSEKIHFMFHPMKCKTVYLLNIKHAWFISFRCFVKFQNNDVDLPRSNNWVMVKIFTCFVVIDWRKPCFQSLYQQFVRSSSTILLNHGSKATIRKIWCCTSSIHLSTWIGKIWLSCISWIYFSRGN